MADSSEISKESLNLEKLIICQDLFASIKSTKEQDTNLLVTKSSELISNLKENKPRKKSDPQYYKWEEIIKSLTCVMSELQDLNPQILYNYSCLLMMVEERDLKKIILLLERVIKASPQLIQAWNDLGDCYWEDGQAKQARDCFLGAVEHDGKNKVGLRNLSIVYRQFCLQGSKEYSDSLKLSYQYAQQAVNCDKDDGISWMILGNTLLSEHFDSPKLNKYLLKKCLTCYRLAENDICARKSPDLYLNLGICLLCLEEFNTALQCYSKASKLEFQSLDIKNRISAILETFQTIQSALFSIRSLSNDKIKLYSKNCSVKFANHLRQIQYSELMPGENKNSDSSINLCVERNINQKELLPCVLLCIDSCANNIICSINGVKQIGVFAQGDVITIISPVLKLQLIEECGISIDCPWISCLGSEYLLLNGKALKNEYIMDAFINHQAFSNLH